ncbi:TolC family protein [Marinilabiliaceae bacterium JC017]|nr:TolC family protein [Marinilabiliaceae bacterium JC017]
MKKLIIAILSCMVLPAVAQKADSLTLEKAIELALENNYGIVIAGKNLEVSQTNNAWGNTGALPTVSFNGSGSKQWNWADDDDYTNNQLSGTVDVNWVVFRGFSARIQKKRLEELEKLSQGNLSITVENTIVDVILSYYTILLEQKKTFIARQNMELSNDRYAREQRKKELGNVETYELLQAQNAYLEDKSDYLLAESNYRNAVRQLNYLMAEPLGQRYTFISTFSPETSEFEYDNLVAKMKSNNNTLRNQYLNLEIARLEVKSAKSAYYPTISATASGGYSGSETDYATLNERDMDNSGYNTRAGLSMTYSIFEGGTRKRAVQVARVQETIANVETREMEQTLENQLAQEFDLYEVRKELLHLSQENLKAAKLNFELTQKKFENGSINSFNYRDVQQIYLNAALKNQNAIYSLVQSYHTLMRLTGGILDIY